MKHSIYHISEYLRAKYSLNESSSVPKIWTAGTDWLDRGHGYEEGMAWALVANSCEPKQRNTN